MNIKAHGQKYLVTMIRLLEEDMSDLAEWNSSSIPFAFNYLSICFIRGDKELFPEEEGRDEDRRDLLHGSMISEYLVCFLQKGPLHSSSKKIMWIILWHLFDCYIYMTHKYSKSQSSNTTSKSSLSSDPSVLFSLGYVLQWSDVAPSSVERYKSMIYNSKHSKNVLIPCVISHRLCQNDDVACWMYQFCNLDWIAVNTSFSPQKCWSFLFVITNFTTTYQNIRPSWSNFVKLQTIMQAI